MQNKIRLLITSCFLTLSLPGLWSQQSVHAAGGNASGTSGTVSYSIGQVAYTSTSSDAGQVSQGVQQPNLMIMVGQVDPVPDVSVGFYPNPVHNDAFLNLGTGQNDVNSAGLSYSLLSVYGTLIFEKDISSNTTLVPMDKLPDGVYLVRVSHEKKTIKTFKVVKTN